MREWIDNLSPAMVNLISIGFGFVTLVIGALFNAYLNRRRDDRLRKEDGRAVAIALREELRSISEALSDAVKVWRESPEMDVIVPDINHLAVVFPAMVPKLGLLNKEAIGPVCDAYAIVAEHSDRLLLLGAQATKVPSGRMQYHLPAGSSEHAMRLNESFAKRLQQAINFLSTQIGDDEAR